MFETNNLQAQGRHAARLQAAALALGCELSTVMQEQLLAYLALIARWNKVYNLTAVRDPDEMLTLHLIDSLAVLPPLRRWLDAQPIRPTRLLDVGSGAGLPGVVLAICCPDLAVTCVDTVGKKAAFIQQVAVTLKLPNLRGLHARVESLGQGYDVVCSRAFSSLVDFVTWSASALNPDGIWLAMKGKDPAEEMAGLPENVAVFHVEQLTVPGLQAERCLVWMRRK
jgi:16S rRNA (guanine527-N7)-methyltransferase